MKRDYARAGVEPPLEELLHDPITQLVMKRDGLELADVRRAIDAVRRRLAGPGPPVVWAGARAGSHTEGRSLAPVCRR